MKFGTLTLSIKLFPQVSYIINQFHILLIGFLYFILITRLSTPLFGEHADSSVPLLPTGTSGTVSYINSVNSQLHALNLGGRE